MVADAPRGLEGLIRARRPMAAVDLCGFRIVVVLGGFYSNARRKACESNKADRYHVMAAPPLMHRKGHAGSGEQQRHEDDHGFGRCQSETPGKLIRRLPSEVLNRVQNLKIASIATH